MTKRPPSDPGVSRKRRRTASAVVKQLHRLIRDVQFEVEAYLSPSSHMKALLERVVAVAAELRDEIERPALTGTR